MRSPAEPVNNPAWMRPGQVFILTLAAIAILSLLLAGAWSVQNAATRSAIATLEQLQLRRDLASVQALASYVLLSEPSDQLVLHVGGRANPDPIEGGLLETGEPVSLRGRPYAVEINGRTIFIRIVATNGLAPIDISKPQALRFLLERLLDDPVQADRMAAALEDYVDPDDLRRLNGAEARDYPDGDAGPANRPLRTAAEACSVLHWDALTFCEDPRLLDLLLDPAIGGSRNPALTPDHLAQVLLHSRDRDRDAALDRLEETGVNSYADLGLDGWDGVMDPELMGYAPPGPGFILIAHEADARVIAARRIDLSYGSIDRPTRRGFDHLIGGVWVETVFAIDDEDEIEVFPVAIPEAGDP